MRWTQTVPQKELKDPKGKIFKHGAKQVVILKKKKRLYIFDNRCPHEGYPLREGTVDGNCVLTCNWHNWKFDLESGKNLFGDDHLRTYPYKIKDGYVWVDFNDAPKDYLKK